MKKMTAIVIGYGMRGQIYADYALKHSEEICINAVAEPDSGRREYAKKLHSLNDKNVFGDYKELCQIPKLADLAIIATQDNMHLEPALMCIEKGYDILLEKPIAPTAKECKIITDAAEKKGVKIIVCHVLRFTDFWLKLKNIIDEGKIGDIMSVIHMENVGNMHQSHSFVRGNWRLSTESSPMILQKSCHDLDILQWLIGVPCIKIQSFGSLSYFNASNKPDGAPDYCMRGCPHKDTCLYEPVKFYTDPKNPWRDIAADKVNATDEDIIEALREGPYGRCVYQCDNDVVDHQVVNMEFENGCTVSFTMSAFNKGGRIIRLFGTKGEISAEMDCCEIKVSYFDGRKDEIYKLEHIGETIAEGHGGGDYGIMRDVVSYFGNGYCTKSISTMNISYQNHLMAFAAEQSRLTDQVIDMREFSKNV